jgi:hypothetical protein
MNEERGRRKGNQQLAASSRNRRLLAAQVVGGVVDVVGSLELGGILASSIGTNDTDVGHGQEEAQTSSHLAVVGTHLGVAIDTVLDEAHQTDDVGTTASSSSVDLLGLVVEDVDVLSSHGEADGVSLDNSRSPVDLLGLGLIGGQELGQALLAELEVLAILNLLLLGLEQRNQHIIDDDSEGIGGNQVEGGGEIASVLAVEEPHRLSLNDEVLLVEQGGAESISGQGDCRLVTRGTRWNCGVLDDLVLGNELGSEGSSSRSEGGGWCDRHADDVGLVARNEDG